MAPAIWTLRPSPREIACSSGARKDSSGTSNSALPGHLLQYQLTIANQGSSGLAAVVVNDATPAYTTFVSAACPPVASLPPGLTACGVSVQPSAGGQGGLQWTFTGTMAAGSQTAVTYQVQVAP